jgi:hypothetical protein
MPIAALPCRRTVGVGSLTRPPPPTDHHRSGLAGGGGA